MALYLNGKGLNNLEANQAVAVMKMDTIGEIGKRAEDNILLKEGDTIYLGSIPPKANVRDITINIFGEYPIGTNIDLYYTDSIGKTTGLVEIALGVVIQDSNNVVLVPLPLSRTLNPDGSPQMSKGNIQSGTKGLGILAVFHEGDRPLEQADLGNIGINFSYSYFGQRGTGGYMS